MYYLTLNLLFAGMLWFSSPSFCQTTCEEPLCGYKHCKATVSSVLSTNPESDVDIVPIAPSAQPGQVHAIVTLRSKGQFSACSVVGSTSPGYSKQTHLSQQGKAFVCADYAFEHSLRSVTVSTNDQKALQRICDFGGCRVLTEQTTATITAAWDATSTTPLCNDLPSAVCQCNRDGQDCLRTPVLFNGGFKRIAAMTIPGMAQPNIPVIRDTTTTVDSHSGSICHPTGWGDHPGLGKVASVEEPIIPDISCTITWTTRLIKLDGFVNVTTGSGKNALMLTPFRTMLQAPESSNDFDCGPSGIGRVDTFKLTPSECRRKGWDIPYYLNMHPHTNAVCWSHRETFTILSAAAPCIVSNTRTTLTFPVTLPATEAMSWADCIAECIKLSDENKYTLTCDSAYFTGSDGVTMQIVGQSFIATAAGTLYGLISGGRVQKVDISMTSVAGSMSVWQRIANGMIGLTEAFAVIVAITLIIALAVIISWLTKTLKVLVSVFNFTLSVMSAPLAWLLARGFGSVIGYVKVNSPEFNPKAKEPEFVALTIPEIYDDTRSAYVATRTSLTFRIASLILWVLLITVWLSPMVGAKAEILRIVTDDPLFDHFIADSRNPVHVLHQNYSLVVQPEISTHWQSNGPWNSRIYPHSQCLNGFCHTTSTASCNASQGMPTSSTIVGVSTWTTGILFWRETHTETFYDYGCGGYAPNEWTGMACSRFNGPQVSLKVFGQSTSVGSITYPLGQGSVIVSSVQEPLSSTWGCAYNKQGKLTMTNGFPEGASTSVQGMNAVIKQLITSDHTIGSSPKCSSMLAADFITAPMHFGPNCVSGTVPHELNGMRFNDPVQYLPEFAPTCDEELTVTASIDDARCVPHCSWDTAQIAQGKMSCDKTKFANGDWENPKDVKPYTWCAPTGLSVRAECKRDNNAYKYKLSVPKGAGVSDNTCGWARLNLSMTSPSMGVMIVTIKGEAANPNGYTEIVCNDSVSTLRVPCKSGSHRMTVYSEFTQCAIRFQDKMMSSDGIDRILFYGPINHTGHVDYSQRPSRPARVVTTHESYTTTGVVLLVSSMPGYAIAKIVDTTCASDMLINNMFPLCWGIWSVGFILEIAALGFLLYFGAIGLFKSKVKSL